MKMWIHSSYGVLECKPMTLQAIENSIPEKPFVINADDTSTAPVNADVQATEPVNEDNEETE